MIVEALEKKLKRKDEGVLQDAYDRAKAVVSERDFIEYCIKTAKDFSAGRSEISIRAKMLPEPLKEILDGLVDGGEVLNLSPKLFMHFDTFHNVRQKLLDIVGEFHRSKPESPGISSEQLLETSRLKKDVFDGLVKLLVSESKLVERKHRLALPGHQETFSDDEQKMLRSIESLYKNRPFNPPKPDEVTADIAAKAEDVQKALKILIEQELLVRVDKDLLFHREAVERARELLTEYIRKEGGLESVKFKYLLDTSRKFAIPLLDYFDRIGVTRRSGYTRYLKT